MAGSSQDDESTSFRFELIRIMGFSRMWRWEPIVTLENRPCNVQAKTTQNFTCDITLGTNKPEPSLNTDFVSSTASCGPVVQVCGAAFSRVISFLHERKLFGNQTLHNKQHCNNAKKKTPDILSLAARLRASSNSSFIFFDGLKITLSSLGQSLFNTSMIPSLGYLQQRLFSKTLQGIYHFEDVQHSHLQQQIDMGVSIQVFHIA